MGDIKAETAKDVNCVSLNTPSEVLYWTNRFSVSEERLRDAVSKAGVDVDAIAQELDN